MGARCARRDDGRAGVPCAGDGEAPRRRRGTRRMRRLGVLALVLVFSCLGVLAGSGAALALYHVESSLPAPLSVEVAAPGDGWARCYEDGACYDGSDGWGAYYVRYVGSGSDGVVDVAAALGEDGKLCGTEVTSTYRMFAGAGAAVEEVRLPDIARFGGKLDPTMFEGAASGSIDLLYREAGATANSGLAVESGAVTPWLVVTDGNVDAAAGAYRGSAKNVYVSSDVSSLAGLFSGSGVERVRLDPDEANPAWVSAAYLFADCASLKGLEEGFSLPEGVTDASHMFSGCGALASLPVGFSLPSGLEKAAGMFSDCTSLTAGALPAGFELPSTVTDAHQLFNGCASLAAVPDGLLSGAAALEDASSMFAGTGVAAVPDGLLDGAPSLVDASAMFQGCANLASVPEGLFESGGKLADASSLFDGCANLMGVVNLPSSVVGVEGMVDGAGASAASHPYDEKGADVGDVGAYSLIVRYDGAAASEPSKAYVERVNADAASRARFVAPVPWEKVGADDGPYTDPRTGKRFYLRYKGSARSVDVAAELDANGEILGAKVTTTDRMFQGLDPNVEEVVLPDVSAYATHVHPDTFGGDLDHEVGLRYRDKGGADYCSALNAADAAKATAWLYLESGNLTGGIYKGPAKNVYISDGITSFENLFKGNGTIEAIDTTGDYTEWTSVRLMFSACTALKELPAGFLGSAPSLKDAYGMLMDANHLLELPSGFLADAPVLTGADYIVGGAEALESLPEGFLSNAPELQSARFALVSCSRLKHVNQDFLRSSAKLKDIVGVFQLCIALQGELTLDLPGLDTCESLLYDTGASVPLTELAYDGEGAYVGSGKGSLAFVVRYPPENSAFAAEAAKGLAGGKKAKLVPIERTAVIPADEEVPNGSSDELAPGDGASDGGQVDAPESQGGEAGSPLEESAVGDEPAEPLPDADGPDPAPDAEPVLPDAAPSEDALEPAPEEPTEPDALAAGSSEDAPELESEEPTEPDAPADDEARVSVHPEREEGLLSAEPPGIVAVAAGGLGLGECFRRRRDETKGRGKHIVEDRGNS